MPDPITITLAEDGTIVGEVPKPLKELLDKTFDAGFGKAYKRAADEAKQQMGDPVDREELKQLRELKAKKEIEEAERQKRYDEALVLHDKGWQDKLDGTTKVLDLHKRQLADALKAEIRAAAAREGARDESLSELGDLLISRVGRQEADLAPVVLGEDGKPAAPGSDGKPVSLGTLVKSYLDSHPHHRKAPAGTGGGARGGATLASGATDAAAKLEEARKTLVRNRTDPAAQRAYQEAQAELKKQTAG